MRRIKNFIYWPWEEKRLFLRALGLVPYYMVLVYLLPSRMLKFYMGNPTTYHPYVLSASSRLSAIVVRRSIYRTMRCYRLNKLCLVYALTARNLLRKYGILNNLYLGVGKRDNRFVAHAWLTCGEFEIVGCEGKDDYKIIAIY